MASRKHLLLIASLIMAGIVVAAPLVAAMTHDPAGIASEGDTVTYHATVRLADRTMVYTTDSDLAAREIESGNTILPKNFSAKPYGAQSRKIEFTDSPWETTRFLVGHRVGDQFETPYMQSPFGSANDQSLPVDLGRFTKRMNLDLEEAFAADGKKRWDVEGLERSDFRVDETLTFATGLMAKVISLEGHSAELQMLTEGVGRVDSRLFGFAIEVEDVDDETVALRPAVVEGDSFQTAGCSIPDGIVRPGNYTVTKIEGGRIYLHENAQGPRAHVLDQVANIEYTILAIEEASPFSRLWLR